MAATALREPVSPGQHFPPARRRHARRLRTAGFHAGASVLALAWFLPIALILKDEGQPVADLVS